MTASADLDELTRLRNAAAICRHGLRQLVHVSGADALTWLDRLISQPVAEIARGQSVRAVFMDNKGRVRADIRILALGEPGDGLLLELPHDEGKLVKLLQMFVIQDDVTIRSAASECSLITLAGPSAEAALESVGLEIPQADEIVQPRTGVAVLGSRLAGVPAYDLVVDNAVLDATVGEFAAAGWNEVSLASLDCVRIEHGVPWFASDLAVEVIPLEALLDEHVSVKKGCYPGQEVVARITNRGQVARKLVRLVSSASITPAPGLALLGCAEQEGKTAGLLTSSCIDPSSGNTLALGYMRRLFWKSGTQVTADGQTMTVHSLDGD
jgi:folate-binding protein YgfZ